MKNILRFAALCAVAFACCLCAGAQAGIELAEGQTLVGLYTSDNYEKFGVGFGGEMRLEAGSRIPAKYYAGMQNLRVEAVRFALAEPVEVHAVKLYALTKDNQMVGPLATKQLEKKCNAGWQLVELDKPVEVKDSYAALVPMYQFDQTLENYVIATSFEPQERSFVVYGKLRTDTEEPVWGNLNGDKYGSVAIQLVCSSRALTGYSVLPDGFSTTTVAVGASFVPTFKVISSSEGEVSSIDYTVTLDGTATSYTQTFAQPIPAGFNQMASFACSLSAPATAGAYPVQFSIDKVNGEPLAKPATATYTQKVVSRAARKMSVVEEFTGTECGWCVRGWVGMEKVKNELPTKACVIALHQFNENDPMYGDYYHRPSFTGGAPTAVIDRGVKSTDPYYGDKVDNRNEGIINAVLRSANVLPEVDITHLEAAYSDEAMTQIAATATTEFLTDMEGSSMVFVLTADSLSGGKAWRQTNFYGSMEGPSNDVYPDRDPELYKFCQGQELGQTFISLIYNDVMIGSSWPSATAPNEVDPFSTTKVNTTATSSYTLTLPATGSLASALRREEIFVTAMVLRADGSIANAARCRVAMPESPDGERADLALENAATPNVAKTGSKLTLTGTLRNKGNVAVKNPVIACTIDGKTVESTPVNCTLSGGQITDFSVNLNTQSINKEGLAHLNLELVWPDGRADLTPADNKASLTPYLTQRSYNRRMVVEEATGCWCGWCVRGIVGLQEMKKEFGDRFIGIAVHTGEDPLIHADYAKWIVAQGVTGYPACFVNRDGIQRNPNYTILRQCMAEAEPYADYDVDATARCQGDALDVTATITPLGVVAEAARRVAFVVVEDGIPGVQYNYYYDGKSGAMGGFESKPQLVHLDYKEVARGAWPTPAGTGDQSLVLPHKMQAGVAQTVTYRIPLDSFKYLDINNCRLVALVLNTQTGGVENACECSLNAEGVHTVMAPSSAGRPAFNLAGQRVGSGTSGLRIEGGRKVLR